jgi:hypothetical protein
MSYEEEEDTCHCHMRRRIHVIWEEDTCVVLPQPVSPATIVTWLAVMVWIECASVNVLGY